MKDVILNWKVRCHFVRWNAVFVIDNWIFVNETQFLYLKSHFWKWKATFVIQMQFDFSVFLRYHEKNGYAKWRSTPSRYFCNRRIHPCFYGWAWMVGGLVTNTIFWEDLVLSRCYRLELVSIRVFVRPLLHGRSWTFRMGYGCSAFFLCRNWYDSSLKLYHPDPGD